MTKIEIMQKKIEIQQPEKQPAPADIKIFERWDSRGVEISDPGLRTYINLAPRTIPHSFARYGNKRFGKTHCSIIERLANDLMVTGHVKDTRVHKKSSGRDTGKKQRVLKSVKRALEIVENKTKKNPVQVLVNAVENTAPCEETTRIRQGGIIAHKSVDVSPQRRLDTAIRLLSHGAAQRCYKKKYTLPAALADEIIAAANYDVKIYSVAKKEEMERIAASAR